MVRRVAGVAALAAALGLAACSGVPPVSVGSSAEDTLTVGVAMPARTPERWVTEAHALRDLLEQRGYAVTLQYAERDVVTQANQVSNLLTGGADLLVIAPVDGAALAESLELAAAQDVPVVSYDRLVRGTPSVDYYVTFDPYRVGTEIAVSLLHGLGLTDLEGNPTAEPPAGPFAVELFVGPPEDSTSAATYNGVMDTLQPYLDAGTLAVPSGEVEHDVVATPRGDPSAAQSRMTRLLTDAAGSRIDGVVSTDDAVSRSVVGALGSFGYGKGSMPMPVVTGQGAERDSVRAIVQGRQHATVFKDSRVLVESAAELVDTVLTGGEPEVTDVGTFFNGVVAVPTRVLPSSVVVAGNVREVLVDSGFYAPGDIGLS